MLTLTRIISKTEAQKIIKEIERGLENKAYDFAVIEDINRRVEEIVPAIREIKGMENSSYDDVATLVLNNLDNRTKYIESLIKLLSEQQLFDNFIENIEKIKNYSNIIRKNELIASVILLTSAEYWLGKNFELCIKAWADVNFEGLEPDNNTPLCLSLKLKNKEWVEILIKAWANVNISNGEGKTPLMYAVESRSIELVKMIVNAGWDLKTKDNEGNDILEYVRKFYLKHWVEFLWNDIKDFLTEAISKDNKKGEENWEISS